MGINVNNPDLDSSSTISTLLEGLGVQAVLTGNALKVLRVNSSATAQEYVAPSAISITSTAGNSKTLQSWIDAVEASDADFLTPEDYGAKGDGIHFANQGAMTAGSAAFSCGNGVFTSADVGKPIVVHGAGAARSRATAAAVSAGGASYLVGDLITVSGGTKTYPTVLRVTSVSAGAVTGVMIWEKGLYTTLPTNPVSVTGGTGSGCTINLTGTTYYMTLATTISGFTSQYAVTLATPAITSVTSAAFTYATDDSAAFQAMETARILMPWGTSVVLRGGAIYGIKNVRILCRDSGGPARSQEGWSSVGGRAHLACIGTVDSDYMIASNRWVDGQQWTGFGNTPITFTNILFNGSGLVKYSLVQNGYQQETFDCEFIHSLVCHQILTRSNQFGQTLNVTGTTVSGSNVITSAAFVSSCGAATSLSDIRVYHLIEGSGFTGVTYITAVNPGAGTITVSRNATANASGVTFLINKNSSGGSYNSECRFERNEYISITTMPVDALFRNDGTPTDPVDASTDGYFIGNTTDGYDITVTQVGAYFGNIGGWFITRQHSYGSLWDMWIYHLGQNYRFSDNQFEEKVKIFQVGAYAGLRTIESNTFWKGLIVDFTSSTGTEVLVLQDPKFTVRNSTEYAQLVCNASYANKTLIVYNPTFTTGLVATGTAPITRPNNLGTIIVRGGVDGDGEMETQSWNDGTFGPLNLYYHNSLSPAVNDKVWRQIFYGNNASGTKKSYGSEEVYIADTTAGSEDSVRRFYVSVAGTETARLSISSDTVNSPVPFYSVVTGGAATGFYASGDGAVSLSMDRNIASGAAPEIALTKRRGTIASPADVVTNDNLGRLIFGARAGGGDIFPTTIRSNIVAATPSATDGQSTITFAVAQNASATPTDMMELRYNVGLSLYGTAVVDPDRGIRYPSYTSTALNAIGNAVNTTNKAAGKTVWNTTAVKLVTAVGSTAGSVWVDGAGTTVNTPV